MRDNTRKARKRGAAWTFPVLLMAGVLWIGPGSIALAEERVPILRLHPEPVPRCPIKDAVTGETGLSTAEISTGEMERMVDAGTALILDARPYEEFSISHIPGAINVAPKPGLPMSQYTSDVAEIDRVTKGDKSRVLILYCNGPFCGKSKRLSSDLVAAGYRHVTRYQLGIPVWRAFGHAAQVEGQAMWSALEKDRTAVVIDAREPAAFAAKTVSSARNVPASEVAKAKDDGRLPMLDHNTRIFVVGKDATEARAAAQEIARNAFHNVAFFAGSFDELMQVRARTGVSGAR